MLATKHYLTQIEFEIALFLIQKTYDQEIDELHCSIIAKKVLELLPENIGLEKLGISLTKLRDIYSELSPIALKYLDLINKAESQNQIEHMNLKINKILYGSNFRR